MLGVLSQMECGALIQAGDIFHFPARVQAHVKTPASPVYNNGQAVAAAAGGMGAQGEAGFALLPLLWVGAAWHSQGSKDLLSQWHHIPPIPAAGLAVRPEPWQAAAME